MSNSTYSQASAAASTMASRVFSRLASGPGPPRWAEISGQPVPMGELGRPSVAQAERAHARAVRRGDPLDQARQAPEITHALHDQLPEVVALGDHPLRAADRLPDQPPRPERQPAADLPV